MARRRRNHKKIVRARTAAIKRQGNLCFWCRKPMAPVGTDKLSATADHFPREKRNGGGDSEKNIVAAHGMCNQDRDKASAETPSWEHEEFLEARDELLRAVGGGNAPSVA